MQERRRRWPHLKDIFAPHFSSAQRVIKGISGPRASSADTDMHGAKTVQLRKDELLKEPQVSVYVTKMATSIEHHERLGTAESSLLEDVHAQDLYSHPSLGESVCHDVSLYPLSVQGSNQAG